MSERDIQSAILEYLQRVRHITCWRQNTGAAKIGDRFVRFGAPGVSDILGVLPGGRFLAIEVKAPKGRLSPAQQTFLDAINASGGVAFVARSVEDVVGRI